MPAAVAPLLLSLSPPSSSLSLSSLADVDVTAELADALTAVGLANMGAASLSAGCGALAAACCLPAVLALPPAFFLAR
jgi:hypothetical protein